jgi:hypothetical protein
MTDALRGELLGFFYKKYGNGMEWKGLHCIAGV